MGTTSLPSRYQILPLTPAHSPWACAIISHSNLFHSTIFARCHPANKAKVFASLMDAAAHLVNHSISHQLSYGVFDTEYPYRSTELSAKGGHFYWSPNDPEILALSDAEAGQALLERMDFPLVSVAMAYDGFYPLSMEQVIPVVTVLPQFGLLFQRLDELDPRIEWKATRPKQVLMRNATSTRRDYEGKGLMAALARYLMREAAGQGFERINIECLSDAVTHVWANPPAPFKGEVVAGFQTKEYRSKDEDGKETDENPFAPSDQYITRVCTTLR